MHAQSHAFYTALSHLSNNDYSTRCVIILRIIYIYSVFPIHFVIFVGSESAHHMVSCSFMYTILV